MEEENTCPCQLCEVYREFEETGVPKTVLDWARSQSIREVAEKAEAILINEKAKRMVVHIHWWNTTVVTVREMVDRGILKDKDFEEALGNPDPTVAVNLYTRLEDYKRSKMH